MEELWAVTQVLSLSLCVIWHVILLHFTPLQTKLKWGGVIFDILTLQW